MRLAVLSDIHGNLTALDAALADLASVGTVDKIWFLGDYVAFGPRPAECIQRVRDLIEKVGKDNVTCIKGNTDRYVINGVRPSEPKAKDADAFDKLRHEMIIRDSLLNWTMARLPYEAYEFLSDLGGETGVNAPGYGYIVGYHGTPGDDEGILDPDTPADQGRDALMDREGRIGVGGHIHVQMDRDIGGWRAVNVGSIGMSKDKPGYAEWGLFTFENGEAQIDLRAVPYDTRAAIADYNTVGFPVANWATDRLKLK